MPRTLPIALGALCLAALPVHSQEPPFAAHAMAALPVVQLTPALRIRTVVGQVGSVATGEFAPGPTRAVHHHTSEQINVGLEGTSGIQIAGRSVALGTLRGTLLPPDVEHVLENDGRASRLLEFQPEQRFDLLPERRQVSLPVGATVLQVPPEWPLETDFASSATGWEIRAGGVQRKAARGRLSAMAVWRLPGVSTAAFDLDLQLPGAEQFVYVIEGTVHLERGARRAEGVPDTLVVSGPNATPIRARGTGQPAVILVLEAIRREAR